MRQFTAIALVGAHLALMGMAADPDSFFQSKTVIIPKEMNMRKGGEDAAEADETCLVMADGVGGYS